MVEFANPTFITIMPFTVGMVALLCVALYRKFDHKGPLIRKRIIAAVYFGLLTALILLALSEPFINVTRPLSQPPPLEIVIDESASMIPYKVEQSEILGLLDGVVPYRVTTFGDDLETPLYQNILSKLKPYTTVLVVSDGQDTTQDVDFSEIVLQAQAVNATIAVFNVSKQLDERSVFIFGPQTTISGVPNTYTVITDGDGAFEGVTVEVNGNQILQTSEPIDQFVQTYANEGVNTITATLSTTRDRDVTNNIFYKTTRVIPKPPVLYIGNDAQMQEFLSQFTEVTTRSSIPADLEPYTAVVLHNQHANSFTNVETLQNFVASGNGLLVIGGDKSFSFSNYDASSLSPLLPVVAGKSKGLNKAAVVLVIDISASPGGWKSSSGSSYTSDELIPVLSYDIISSLGSENLMGIVGYYQEPVLISPLQTLGQNRNELLDKVSRLQFDKAGSQMNKGLEAAWKMLEPVTGAKNVIILSDGTFGGSNSPARTLEVGQAMAQAGINLYVLGIGEASQMGVIRSLASKTNGVFLQPDETDKLGVLFSDIEDNEDSTPRFSLEITDNFHPITSSIEGIGSDLSAFNAVIPKLRARLLATTTNGDPAVVTWKYGIGRVTTVTAFTGTQQLGGLLSAPDSRLLARAVSYAIGDPEKKLPPQIRIDDTTLGIPARVTANGPIPNIPELNFDSITNDLHLAFMEVNQTGVQERYGATFAVSYPVELQEVSIDERIEELSILTEGKTYSLATLKNIRDLIDETATVQKQQIVPLFWWALLAAALVLLAGIVVRKIEEKL